MFQDSYPYPLGFLDKQEVLPTPTFFGVGSSVDEALHIDSFTFSTPPSNIEGACPRQSQTAFLSLGTCSTTWNTAAVGKTTRNEIPVNCEDQSEPDPYFDISQYLPTEEDTLAISALHQFLFPYTGTTGGSGEIGVEGIRLPSQPRLFEPELFQSFASSSAVPAAAVSQSFQELLTSPLPKGKASAAVRISGQQRLHKRSSQMSSIKYNQAYGPSLSLVEGHSATWDVEKRRADDPDSNCGSTQFPRMDTETSMMTESRSASSARRPRRARCEGRPSVGQRVSCPYTTTIFKDYEEHRLYHAETRRLTLAERMRWAISVEGTSHYKCGWPCCPGRHLFGRFAELDRHIRTIHTAERGGAHCPNCSRTFARKDGLHRHSAKQTCRSKWQHGSHQEVHVSPPATPQFALSGPVMAGSLVGEDFDIETFLGSQAPGLLEFSAGVVFHLLLVQSLLCPHVHE